jgi:hypothetical protein
MTDEKVVVPGEDIRIVAVANGNACAYTSFVGDPGLTKRELLAAMAMQAIETSNPQAGYEDIAVSAVKQADALLKELAK